MSKEDRGPSRVMWRPTGRIGTPGPKAAWRALIAKPTEENRAAFEDALRRAGR